MKRTLFIVGILLTLCIVGSADLVKVGGSGKTKVGGSGTTKVKRSIYFGNCETSGAVPVGWANTFDFFGAKTSYGFSGAQDFTCPGTGPQRINLMGLYGKTRGAPHASVRMAIYTYTEQSADGGTIYDSALALVCQWSSSTLVNNATAQWWDNGSLTGTTTLTGGVHYRIAETMSSALLSYAYTTGVNLSKSISTDYSGGFPDPIGAGSNNGEDLLMRVSVTGNGGTAAAPTQETFYVNTDYSGGGSTGSLAKPYINLQTCIAARCNKTFTLPIVIYCSGAARDTIRVNTGGLGQFVASAGKELRIYGNFAGTTKDSSKYGIETAFASGAGAGMCMALSNGYIWIEGVQVGQSTLSGQNAAAEIVYWSSGNTGYMKNFLVYGCNDSNAANTTRGFSSINGINLINGIICDLGAGVGTGIKNHQNSNFYSLTVKGPTASGGCALDISDGTCVGKNLYLSGPVSIIYGTGTLAQTTVATSDALANGTALDNIAWSTANFTNVTAGSVDVALPTGSALKNVGTDTSGDASPFNFTTDITGATRSGTWDIGADEF